jgi:hypothetical protein
MEKCVKSRRRSEKVFNGSKQTDGKIHFLNLTLTPLPYQATSIRVFLISLPVMQYVSIQ